MGKKAFHHNQNGEKRRLGGWSEEGERGSFEHVTGN